jgi:hypothetical protein
VPQAAVGRRVKCRKCATVLRVPDPAAQEPAPDDDGSALDALAAATDEPLQLASTTEVAQSLEIEPLEAAYPRCAVAYTGREAPDDSARIMFFQLLRGTIGCLIGTALGCALWTWIATMGYFSSWIALLVGLLSGTGMYYGIRDPSLIGGVLAALFAGCGIVVANTICVYWVDPSAAGVAWPVVMIATLLHGNPFIYAIHALAMGAAYWVGTRGTDE